MLSRVSRLTRVLAVSLVVLMLANQLASAEIPHENYDLVSGNIDIIIELLRAGINATELACVSCLDLRPVDGLYNLTLLDSVLIPVSVLIDDIRNITTTYENLTYLTPPFNNLTAGGNDFIPELDSFLDGLGTIRSYQQLSALTPSQFIVARDLVSTLRQKVYTMNSALDDMDFACDGIANLTVDQERPFNTTYLKELIDRLRIMIDILASELDDIFFNIKWNTPFITFVLDDDTYYLGETVRGGGYVYDGNTTVIFRQVNISMDGGPLVSISTNSQGSYSFQWTIPVNSTYLGQHSLNASAFVKGKTIFSQNRTITVLKIPTRLSISVNGWEFRPDQNVRIASALKDYRGVGLPSQTVEILVDANATYHQTDSNGRIARQFVALSAGWGSHASSADYNGTDVYDSSASVTIEFSVSIPTALTLALSSYRVEQGAEVDVWADLVANASEPLDGKTVLVTIDDAVLVSDQTNANGNITYVLNTSDLSIGTHILRARYDSSDPMYRSAESNAVSLIIYAKSDTNVNPPDDTWDWDDFWKLLMDWLWLILLIIIIMIITILVMSSDTYKNAMSARRREADEETETEAAETTQAQTEGDAEHPSEAAAVEENGIDFSGMPVKEAVVLRYSMLLENLHERDVPLRPNMTARDIGRLLASTGYPEEACGIVTDRFELAKYSNRTIGPNDLEAFERAAEEIERHAGGKR